MAELDSAGSLERMNIIWLWAVDRWCNCAKGESQGHDQHAHDE